MPPLSIAKSSPSVHSGSTWFLTAAFENDAKVPEAASRAHPREYSIVRNVHLEFWVPFGLHYTRSRRR